MKWIYSLLATIVMVSCSHFEEMNVDPNNPSNIPTAGLLTQAQANLVYSLNGELSQLGGQYVQHFTQIDYAEKSNYGGDGRSSFTGMYRSGLKDLDEIIKLNTQDRTKVDALNSGDNDNQIAVANIIQTWAYHNMTDIWGDIPYSEALKGNEGILTPKYDTQESIYDELIAVLDESIGMINTAPVVALKGDLIFNGNMLMWRKFAESLRLRIAMRLSEVNDSKANSLIDDANFANAFSTASDVVEFGHWATDNEANPYYIDNVINVGADYFAMTNTLIDAMSTLNDPRISTYANVAVTSGTYVGLEVGVLGNDTDFSLPGDMYVAQTAPSVLMTAAEILFIKAEAAQRGYIGGDPATFYNDAITVSMEYNGINAADIATYLAQPEVAYDPVDWREKIGTQKWLALYAQGIQAWAEWRRLDFPVLTPGVNAVLPEIPRRRAYTNDEYSTNKHNVEAAVLSSLGCADCDLMTGRVWWDQ